MGKVFAGGLIEAYVGPQELEAADNLETVIIEFIREARITLDVAVQEIDSEPIAQALIEASWRGVSVRMIVEHDYVYTKKPPGEAAVIPAGGETEEHARHRVQWLEDLDAKRAFNREVLVAMLRNGIDIKTDYNQNHIFHQKFIIRDDRKHWKKGPHPAILSGSTNFTQTGTHANLNHVIIFDSQEVSDRYRSQFEEMREGIFGASNRGIEPNPTPVNLNGVPVQVLFGPDNLPEMQIIKQMLKSKSRIDFAIFTFSGSSGIDDAMIALRQAGIKIRGAIDPGQGLQNWAATPWLHDKGIEMFLPRRVHGFGKLHHKLMVVDDNIVVAGSMNYTKPANEYNDENVFIMGSPYPDLAADEGGPVDGAECAALTTFFRDEIDRIIAGSDPFEGGTD